MMSPLKVLLSIISLFVVLGVIALVYPDGGIHIGDITLRYRMQQGLRIDSAAPFSLKIWVIPSFFCRRWEFRLSFSTWPKGISPFSIVIVTIGFCAIYVSSF